MPLSVYTFSVDNQEHIFQTFENNVIVASVKSNGKTVYLSNKFLEKIGENAIRISLKIQVQVTTTHFFWFIRAHKNTAS